MSDRLVLRGTLLRPAADRTVRLQDGALVIEQGRITRVLGADEAARHTPDLGSERAVIAPGFIDTHVHIPQFDCIGADGLELLEWLDRVIFPAEAAWSDADHAGAMTLRVADELLSFGTTGVAAYCTVHHEAARAAIRALASRNIRAVTGQVLMDRGAPPELVRPVKTLLIEAASLEPEGRVELASTPRFAVSCTDELLRGAGELASRRGLAVQTHLSETEPECALVRELFGGLAYTEIYRRAGLLGPRSILGHGVWLDDAERRTLAESGAVVAHCPTANLFLRAGAMDRPGLHSAGVRTSLGSDVAGGPDRSMVRVARAMIETAKRRGDPAPAATEAWWQITRGNAEALGWADAGRIEPGSPADLVVFEPATDWRHATDPASTLLYAWDDRWVAATLLEGRPAFTRPA